MSREQIQIISRQDGTRVRGEIDTAIEPVDLVLLERSWGPVRLELFNQLQAAGVDRREYPQSLHWDWSLKAADLKLVEASGIGIFAAGKWQGAMLTKAISWASKLRETTGLPLVYIDYLETAPWNWSIPALSLEGEFKGIGSLLFWRALIQSVQEGFSGRLGLHALPQSEEFYANACKMTPLGHDPTKERLMYFELDSVQAGKLLLSAREGGV